MNSAKAFAPANISCIFGIYSHKNPRWMGSYGLGFTINKGVVAETSKSKKTEIFFNNAHINFPTVKSVIKRLNVKTITISIKTKLPLGCGFGLSGASALATAYALNKLLKLKKSNKELAIIAHTAEVENKTGLGDVVNQFYGGCCLKLRPSSHFIVKKLPLNNADVYCRHFSKISTKSVITNPKLKNNINKSASKWLNKIEIMVKSHKNIKFKELIEISGGFAVESRLMKNKRVIKIIKSIKKNNGNASMIMLGNAVFSDMPFKGAGKFKISETGAHLI